MGGASRDAVKPLRFKVQLPHLRLDLDADAGSLPEVRRIIEALNVQEGASEVGDDAFFELRARLSEEFFQHEALASRLKNALVLDEEVRILKRVLPVEQEYDLDAGKSRSQVNALDVKGALTVMFDEVGGTVREALIHLRGELSREQQSIIMDAVKQRLGLGVKTRFFSTRRNLEGNVLVEAVCFGDGIAEGW